MVDGCSGAVLLPRMPPPPPPPPPPLLLCRWLPSYGSTGSDLYGGLAVICMGPLLAVICMGRLAVICTDVECCRLAVGLHHLRSYNCVCVVWCSRLAGNSVPSAPQQSQSARTRTGPARAQYPDVHEHVRSPTAAPAIPRLGAADLQTDCIATAVPKLLIRAILDDPSLDSLDSFVLYRCLCVFHAPFS